MADYCGEIKTINGREWICVRPPHDTEERPPEIVQMGAAGPFMPEVKVEGDKHRFVKRYPTR